MEDSTLVDGIARMGEAKFSSSDLRVLKALGLGSCIGLVMFDSALKLGCMAHIVLPEARKETNEVAKYANDAVPFVIKQMVSKGASKNRLRAIIAGGAQLFSIGNGASQLDVGKRNTEAVKSLLKDNRIPILAEDVGGNSGRTLLFDCDTGKVTVKLAGADEKVLAKMA